MYKIYYTADTGMPYAYNEADLKRALAYVDALRNIGYTYVTMVSDYQNMSGKPGAQMSGTEYVPQMLNP